MPHLVGKAVALLKAEGLSATLRVIYHWMSEKYFGWRFGIRTSKVAQLEDMSLDRIDPDWIPYQAVDYQSFTMALSKLDIDPDRDVFVDLGCGKGRALVVAAAHPFRKVIGVELAPELAEIAKQNIVCSKVPLNSSVEVVNADVVEYSIPSDVTVIFIYNSFRGAVFQTVLDKIVDSLNAAPRRMSIIFKYPDWAENLIEDLHEFEVRHEIPCISSTGERLLIYENDVSASRV